MKRLKKFEEYNLEETNEGLVGEIASTALAYILSPIAITTFINANTKFKIGVIENNIKKYLSKKVEYEVLDEARYDIEMPSLLKKITSRRNELSKYFKKYPTLEDYKKDFCKWLRKWNLINFRNKIDIDYICDKIMEIGPEDERILINYVKSFSKFDIELGKVVNRHSFYESTEKIIEKIIKGDHRGWGRHEQGRAQQDPD